MPQAFWHPRHVDHAEALSLVTSEGVALDAAQPLRSDEIAGPVMNVGGCVVGKCGNRHIGVRVLGQQLDQRLGQVR